MTVRNPVRGPKVCRRVLRHPEHTFFEKKYDREDDEADTTLSSGSDPVADEARRATRRDAGFSYVPTSGSDPSR